MKWPGLFLLSFATLQFCHAQNIGLDDISGLLELPANKLEKQLHKRGFKREAFFDGHESPFIKTKRDKEKVSTFRFKTFYTEDGVELVYQTTLDKEFQSLVNQLRLGGFRYPEKIGSIGTVYQKQNLVVTTTTETEDTTVFYTIKAGKKTIPLLKELQFAEDLLQLDSHEFLSEAFGKQNVKSDEFYFSATIKKKCSIIFPNSSRQAIFLWNDEENLREISYIIIGEQVSNDAAVDAVRLSDWRSKQGIYCGMSLAEVLAINQNPISFYNWKTESAGFLAPQSEGILDFDKIIPVFNCMNCSFLYINNDVEIIESNYAMQQNQKVYIGSFVVVPGKKPEYSRSIVRYK